MHKGLEGEALEELFTLPSDQGQRVGTTENELLQSFQAGLQCIIKKPDNNTNRLTTHNWYFYRLCITASTEREWQGGAKF